MDERVALYLQTAAIAYDKRCTAHERKKGWITNTYRLAHLCGALNRIRDRVFNGETWEQAIDSETEGRFRTALLRGLVKARKCDPEHERGYTLGKAAAEEVIRQHGRRLAEDNLIQLASDKSIRPFDLGYLTGYRLALLK